MLDALSHELNLRFPECSFWVVHKYPSYILGLYRNIGVLIPFSAFVLNGVYIEAYHCFYWPREDEKWCKPCEVFDLNDSIQLENIFRVTMDILRTFRMFKSNGVPEMSCSSQDTIE